MFSSSRKAPPTWTWPEDLPDSTPGAFPEPSQKEPDATTSAESTQSTSTPNQNPEHRYPPRMCRICLDTVNPTSETESQYLPSMLQSKPRVVYVSPDPELGRLIRPCKCKGSSRYVHEGCLQSWRHADPSYGRRNYFQCPTCGFKYRIQRVIWARWITSSVAQLALTFSILLLTVFILGFIADPIINLYLPPVDTIIDSDFWEETHVLDVPDLGEATTWFEHFLKGLASLGVLSIIKVFLAMSPWGWLHLRSSALFGAGGRTTGRTRVASISWVVILFGVVTFLVAVFKGVRQLVHRTLRRAGESVLDIQGEDDDKDLDEGSDHVKKED
ncbi:RING finger domain protein [Talaromyces stipitatus ATCC 10500]|uniref:RING finger domain protein n=1 Tax=Talaromyces stipitatus (strain ATCC 10500 / CBS 375.48 / QM 6759 / NRRL 1006) TaxID=441959 RepID=B8MLK0_TALSN|nr:RING finger domain protein [Talaromyces stipitatus ATCC 10500]EED15533.1 RING finger domain protein [Talaromyces stipitatus ATCC 10500]